MLSPFDQETLDRPDIRPGLRPSCLPETAPIESGRYACMSALKYRNYQQNLWPDS